MMRPALIVHGGAWDWSDKWDEPKSESIRQALIDGWAILQAGGSALDAVERAVIHLEDDPLFDAGLGSHLNRNGIVEMDALIIDASQRNFGAVGSVQHVRNPIKLARQVLEASDENFFVGAGADALAQELGLELVPNLALVSKKELKMFYRQTRDAIEAHDTVGAIAIDANGKLAAATSTGGTPYKPAGRVGDSPIFGAGGYADRRYGGAGATGKGEHSMRVLLSSLVVQAMAQGHDAQSAAQLAIQETEDLIPNSMVGTIALDVEGRVGAAHSTPKLAHGWIDEHGNPQARMRGVLIEGVSV